MEIHHNLKLKRFSHFIPSSFTSCRFRTLPDVAECSIPITKSNKTRTQLHENDLTPVLNHSSDAEGRKCPPVTPISSLNPKNKKSPSPSFNHASSSSNNSGLFTSSDDRTRAGGDEETEAFFSLSSISGDSFHLKSSRRFKKCEEMIMKSIDETGRYSFSSVNSYDTVLNKSRRKKTVTATGIAASKEGKRCRKVCPEEYELVHDQISTDLYYYYNKNRDSGTKDHRRKKTKNLRKTRGGFKGSMIEESHAVEMNSVDPRSDFRESMVEMIVKKQMFGAGDLQRLLFCLLSLNEVSYHEIILDVFSEICQTLFSN